MTTLFSVKTRQKHRVSVSKNFHEKIFSNGTLLEINLAATFSGIVRNIFISVCIYVFASGHK